MARQPYERRVFSVKVSFVREKCESQAPPREGAAWNSRIFDSAPSVDERTGIFFQCARQTASDRAFSLPVDSGGQVDNVCAFSRRARCPQQADTRRSRICRARIGPRVMNPVK